jgi:hypothetical protein
MLQMHVFPYFDTEVTKFYQKDLFEFRHDFIFIFHCPK